jgi:hypothetical protein
VWRDNEGGPGTALLNRDPQNTGPIGQDDYNSWRANFGELAGAAAAGQAAVPEPATFVLLGFVLLVMLSRRTAAI